MKNYDKKVKQTRILLSDYLLLKSIAQRTGVSMAEALHKIVTRDWANAQPAIKVKAPVTLPVKAPVAYRSGRITALATNGSKVAAFRITPKGASYD